MLEVLIFSNKKSLLLMHLSFQYRQQKLSVWIHSSAFYLKVLTEHSKMVNPVPRSGLASHVALTRFLCF